jgi:hypothetical protein
MAITQPTILRLRIMYFITNYNGKLERGLSQETARPKITWFGVLTID